MTELPDGPKVCNPPLRYSNDVTVPCIFQNALKFTWVSHLDEVLLNAFDGGLKPACKL